MKKGIPWILSIALLAALLSSCGQTPAESESSSAAPVSESAAQATPEPDESASPEAPAEETPAETDAGEDSYTPGVRTDTNYTNPVLELCFTPTGNMVMASDEEIQSMMQAGTDVMYQDPDTSEKVLDYVQLTTIYEMVAVDVTNGSSVTLMAEKLPFASIGMDQYIEALKAQIGQTTATAEFGDPETVTLAGAEYTGLTYTLEVNNTQATQTLLLKKVGSRMYALVFSYSDAASYQNLLGCFTAQTAV